MVNFQCRCYLLVLGCIQTHSLRLDARAGVPAISCKRQPHRKQREAANSSSQSRPPTCNYPHSNHMRVTGPGCRLPETQGRSLACDHCMSDHMRAAVTSCKSRQPRISPDGATSSSQSQEPTTGVPAFNQSQGVFAVVNASKMLSDNFKDTVKCPSTGYGKC